MEVAPLAYALQWILSKKVILSPWEHLDYEQKLLQKRLCLSVRVISYEEALVGEAFTEIISCQKVQHTIR